MKFEDIFKNKVEKKPFNGFVIYSGPAWYTLNDIGESYLESAEKLLKPFKEAELKGQEHDEDSLAHPCLFLLRHSVESSLKYYLVCLINYNHRHKFFNLKADWEKPFRQHWIGPIANLIWSIVSKPGIFQNVGFKRYLNFANRFDEIDNNSTAFRYSTDLKGKTQKIHEDEWYVDALLFLDMVKSLRQEIWEITEGRIYSYEDYGYFEESTISYIEGVLTQFHRFQKILKENPREVSEQENNKPSRIVNGADIVERMRTTYPKYVSWRKKISEIVLKDFEEKEIIEACEGMYFGRDGQITRPQNSHRALEKLFEKHNQFEKFNMEASKQLENIKKLKLVREESPIFDV